MINNAKPIDEHCAENLILRIIYYYFNIIIDNILIFNLLWCVILIDLSADLVLFPFQKHFLVHQ